MPTPTEYTRAITTNPNLAALQAAIEDDATITPRTVSAIAYEQGHIGYQVRLTTDDALTDPAQTDALDAVIAAHTGKVKKPRYHDSLRLVGPVVAITTVDTWQDLGSIVTTPGFFTGNPAVFASLVGSVKADGAGAELRLVQDVGHLNANGKRRVYDGTPAEVTVLTSTPYAIGDTSDAWEDAEFKTDVAMQLETRNEYRLEGRLGVTGTQATTADVRVMVTALMEPG